MKKVLFVDDDAGVINGLKRMLRPLRNEWEMHFAHSASEALALLAGGRFDVIVSDMRMPGMNGADLLAQVRDKYPHMIRIILSGYSDQDLLLKAVRPAHQFLTKPCDAETLKNTVRRISSLQDLLSGEEVKSVISKTDSLPSLPRLYSEIINKLQNEDVSITDIGKIIEQDVGMTAQILKLVNSSFFGFFNKISSPVQAVSLLGLETIKTLVLSVEIFSMLQVGENMALPFNELLERSTLSGLFAKKIAREVSADKQFIDDAFAAGFLIDIGILLLAAKLPEEYSKVLALARKEKLTLQEAESRVLKSGHAEIGAYLLGLWGFSENIVEAIARHHTPEIYGDEPNSLITVLHVSDAFVDRILQTGASLPLGKLEEKYISDLKLNSQTEKWFEICRQLYESGSK